MATSRTSVRASAVVCGIAALLLPMAGNGASTVPEVTLSQSVRQITTDPGDEYDPSLSGDLVVYTGNRDNNTDIY